jgi:prolyl-tRNA synthetase
MRMSQLFSRTRRDFPADETSKNAQLLIKAGYIYKEMAGVYAYLPLGLKVVENLKRIIREEMESVYGQEMIMTSLQSKELWQMTDRWDDKRVDIWFKSKLRNGNEVGLAWSHEEPITNMMRGFIASYKDLPAYVYQFQTKLRNETRAKSGIMRCREFVMKDLYSYSRSEADHQAYYDKVTKAYLRVFDRAGLGKDTYFTFASGGAFTKFSHEFQTITETGEDTIYVDYDKRIAVNEEVFTDEVIQQLGLKKDKLDKVKAAEVGNIFSFGDKKSKQLDLYFTDEDGSKKPVILGSYGIGVTRLMGVIVEHFADDNGLVWPKNVAPAQIYLARVENTPNVVSEADKIYKQLTEAGIEVIYDDRDVRPGEKFADGDMLGIPHRVVVSQKTIKAGVYEVKSRISGNIKHLSYKELLKQLS